MTHAYSRYVFIGALALTIAASADAQFAAPIRPPAPVETTQAITPPVVNSGYVPVSGGLGNTYNIQGPLQGVANLTTATGQYYQQIEQAKLTQEQVYRSQLETRRQVNAEKQYEYDTRRTQGQMIAEDQAARIQRSRNNPPATIIWSGDALNDLLNAITFNETHFGIRGASLGLDPDTLQYINVTAGVTQGSVGLFRDGRPLYWPLPLLDDRFQTQRELIDTLSATTVKSIVDRKLNVKALKDLIAAIATLKEQVAAATADQSPTDNIKSMRYVNQLRDGAQALTDLNAINFLNGKWSAKGSTVGELVVNMSNNGLKFAPATEGTEPYYNQLYQAMLNYDTSVVRLTSAK